MSNSKPKDICQIRYFNTELVQHVQNTLPSDDTLETAQTSLAPWAIALD